MSLGGGVGQGGVWGRGRRTRGPGAVTIEIARLEVGERGLVYRPKDRVRDVVRGERGWFRVNCPERRFEIGALDRRSCFVWRRDDVRRYDFEAVFREAMGAARGAVVHELECRTLVPLETGFGEWLVEAGVAAVSRSGRCASLVHQEGWAAQWAFMVAVRDFGWPARRMGYRF